MTIDVIYLTQRKQYEQEMQIKDIPHSIKVSQQTKPLIGFHAYDNIFQIRKQITYFKENNEIINEVLQWTKGVSCVSI